jgi:chemotaxis protein CheX
MSGPVAIDCAREAETVDVKYINPFIQATSNVFKTVLGCDIQRQKLLLKDDYIPFFDVSAVIGFSGKANGAVVFSVPPAVAFVATQTMLETEVTEINSDVVDAIGELANMIAGGAKTSLSSFQLSLGLPSVVIGRSHSIQFPSDVRPICVLFETPSGPIALEVGLDTQAVEAPLVDACAAACS